MKRQTSIKRKPRTHVSHNQFSCWTYSASFPYKQTKRKTKTKINRNSMVTTVYPFLSLLGFGWFQQSMVKPNRKICTKKKTGRQQCLTHFFFFSKFLFPIGKFGFWSFRSVVSLSKKNVMFDLISFHFWIHIGLYFFFLFFLCINKQIYIRHQNIFFSFLSQLKMRFHI